MNTVTVSPEFQVVIPRHLCQSLGLKPGQKIQVFLYGSRIELIPIRPIKKARGFLATFAEVPGGPFPGMVDNVKLASPRRWIKNWSGG